MKINWFTVIAQIINFLILVWLMKRFLYKPILSAIDEREKKIAAQLADAAAQKAEALKERDEFSKKNAAFDAQQQDLLNKAISASQAQGNKLLEDARNEATANSAKEKKELEDQQHSMQQAITVKIQEEVFAGTRKSLTDMASVNLEAQVVNTFIQRFKAISAEEKKQFITAFQPGSATVLIKSAFELSPQQQKDIENSINTVITTKTVCQFKVAPELITGIELMCNGYKFEWNTSAYLSSLEKSASTILKDLSQIKQ